MQYRTSFVIPFGLFVVCLGAGARWIESSSVHLAREISHAQSDFDKREAAYRANNIGVALLEQYKANEAVESFKRALAIKSDLLIARINLAIALYYLPDAESAKREAGKALTQDANAPQPHYILGLIARAQSRFDDAVAEFQKVLHVDADDVGTNVNLGQIFGQQKKYAEAIAAFRRAIEAEPFNETALYNLGLLLTRTGKKEEGQQLIKKFQQFQATGAGTTIGNNYLEGGHYAEAVVSTGAENELVDRSTPNVAFIDATQQLLPADSPLSGRKRATSRGLANRSEKKNRAEAVVLFDFDGDGDLDLFDAAGSQRLLRNDGGRFVDVTAESGLSITGGSDCFAAVAGDYDNDGKPDLLVVRANPAAFVLYHNDGGGHFSDRTKQSGISVPSAKNVEYDSVAFVDFDHDGDLDILISGTTTLLFRNNGNGTFTEIAQASGLSAIQSSPVTSAIVPTDFNNSRDIDLFLLSHGSPPRLFSNMRDGTFHDVAKDAGLNVQNSFSAVAAGDVNKDGFTDFFLGGAAVSGLFAISDGHKHFKVPPPPDVETRGALAAQFLDYDNDGLLDLVLVTTRGPRIFRNDGDDFHDVSRQALSTALQNLVYDAGSPQRVALVSGDLDGDGDVDLIFREPGGALRILRNEGGNRNHSIKIDLHGRVSNKSAIEAKIEMRAGSLYQKLETYSASPAPAPADLIFGLGKRDRPDAVRVLWPAGIVQAETEFPAAMQGHPALISLNITELDRKPSSCPYLYAWNGERFEFVTDFMGTGEMGYLEEPGRISEPGAVANGSRRRIARHGPFAAAWGSERRFVGRKLPARYNTPDPDEYVRITGNQLKEKDGRYELRVTNELEEALFVDRLQLLAVTHPVGTDVYPNEGMSNPPKPFKLFVTHNARPPLSAVDDRGSDVLDLISHLDRRWPDDFKVDPIRGYAEEHVLTLKLAESFSARRSLAEETKNSAPERRSLSVLQGGAAASKDKRTLLLLTGWTDYAWSSDNVAASQAGKTMKPPSLEVKDRGGKWRTVIEDIGIPVGRPQTVTVDLTGKFFSASREVRILTNMRIHWDQILVDTSDSAENMKITRLDPVSANLRWRGFSTEVTPDGREPFGYDYQNVLFTSPWKVMTGHYTREGDVRELLLNSDDMFVICRSGDEIALSFDATALPALPNGWTRTFLLYADGFSKEMDINSASPDQILPLPFHSMSRYPYPWPEHYPMDAKHLEYIEKYNTRFVGSEVPFIDAAILGR